MPATKSDTKVFDSQLLNSGIGAITNSPYVDLPTKYGGIWQIKVVNASTRLSKGVEVQAEISPDKVSGNEYPFDCRHIAGQDADEDSRFTIRIPPEVKFARLVITEGDEDANITAIFTSLDQV